MRITSLLFISALLSSNHISHAFPLKPQASPKRPAVRRRVAYSVVAVDGGSAATPPAAPVPDTITLIQTSDSIVTVTAPPSSMPLLIETIVATDTVSELEPAKTVDIIFTQDVTELRSPTAILSYIVVNPAETPTPSSTRPLTSQTYTSVPSLKCANSFSTSTPTSTTSSPPSSILSSVSTWSSISTSSMPLESSHRASEAAHPAEAKSPEAKDPEAAPIIPSPHPPPPSPPTIISSGTLSKTPSKTYDDGMWHTSYPVWNATSTVLWSVSATAVGTGRVQNIWRNG